MLCLFHQQKGDQEDESSSVGNQTDVSYKVHSSLNWTMLRDLNFRSRQKYKIFTYKHLKSNLSFNSNFQGLFWINVSIQQDERDKVLLRFLASLIACCYPRGTFRCLRGFYSMYGIKLSMYHKTTALNRHDQIFNMNILFKCKPLQCDCHHCSTFSTWMWNKLIWSNRTSTCIKE